MIRKHKFDIQFKVNYIGCLKMCKLYQLSTHQNKYNLGLTTLESQHKISSCEFGLAKLSFAGICKRFPKATNVTKSIIINCPLTKSKLQTSSLCYSITNNSKAHTI